MKIKHYSFDDGKYEIHSADDGSLLEAYRHGEYWQNMIGDNLTAAMLHRIDDLEASVSRLIYASLPVSNAAYNLAWQHRDEKNVHENVATLDYVRQESKKLLSGNT